MNFSYILDKIRSAPMLEAPFRHIEIHDLFEAEHFEAITRCDDVAMAPARSDEELFSNLFGAGYRIISFPGCTEDADEYMRWHRQKATTHHTSTACEGFGVVLRLSEAQTDVGRALQDLLTSDELVACLAERFDIDRAPCSYDAGVQKYLDGYEISPHPDVRRKALTFMVNINPSPSSEQDDIHTSYAQFKPEFDYVRHFWGGNLRMDRCWVPWSWVDVKKQQRSNNSMVIFSPSNDTLHAVKANYDHLTHQRTQLYGNLWYPQTLTEETPSWEDLQIRATTDFKTRVKSNIKKFVPEPMASAVRRLRGKERKDDSHADRNV